VLAGTQGLELGQVLERLVVLFHPAVV